MHPVIHNKTIYNRKDVKSMVFPVAMYGCEIWTIKEAEHQRIGGFELWCWRRILRVPWTGRRSNQSILKEINVSIDPKGRPGEGEGVTQY